MELKLAKTGSTPSFFLLLIAPLMELKLNSGIRKHLRYYAFNRTAYGIEI